VLLLLFGGYARRHAVSSPLAGSVLVSGAGTAEANGTYTPRGTENGKTYYNLMGEADNPARSAIAWDGTTNWVILDSTGGNLYFASEDIEFPWLASAWEGNDGDPPSPTVTEA
jgi:hypothetical protein